MIEVLVPLYRVVEWDQGTVLRTEPAGERWVPVADAVPGRVIDGDLRVGTPDRLRTRVVPDKP